MKKQLTESQLKAIKKNAKRNILKKRYNDLKGLAELRTHYGFNRVR